MSLNIYLGAQASRFNPSIEHALVLAKARMEGVLKGQMHVVVGRSQIFDSSLNALLRNSGPEPVQPPKSWGEREVHFVPRAAGPEKSKDYSALIAVSSAVIGLIFAFFVGKAYTAYNKAARVAEETATEFSDFRTAPYHALHAQNNGHADYLQVASVLAKQQNLFASSRQSAAVSLGLRSAAFGGSAFALWGSLAALPALTALGMGGVFLSGSGMLFRWGCDAGDESISLLAKKILKDIHLLTPRLPESACSAGFQPGLVEVLSCSKPGASATVAQDLVNGYPRMYPKLNVN